MLTRLAVMAVMLATAATLFAVRSYSLAQAAPARYASGLSLYRMDQATARRALDAVDSLETFGLLMPDRLTLVTPSSDVCDQMLSMGTAAETTWEHSFIDGLAGIDPQSVVRLCDNWSYIVMVHELTHTWDNARLTDQQRDMLQTYFDAPTWNDQRYEWSQRGAERLAERTVDCVLGFQPPGGSLCTGFQSILSELNSTGNQVYVTPTPGWEARMRVPRLDMLDR